MKSVFVSCPMRGRSKKSIEFTINKMHKIAEAYVGEDLTLIESYNPDSNFAHSPIFCLGESIKKMQDADYFICIDGRDPYNGCDIEYQVAYRYNIPIIECTTELVAPDVFEKYYKSGDKSNE